MSNYIKIPDIVRYNQNLKASSKLIFGEIWSLTSKEGYCFATNGYLGKIYGLSRTTISDCISQLNDEKYIKIVYADGKRRISLSNILSRKLETPTRKLNTPLQENLKHINNNSNNIIYNNNNSVKSKKDFPQLVIDSYEPLCSLFPKKAIPKTKAQKNSWLDCIDKLDRLDGYNPRKVYFICKKVRQDDFWKDNFLSILKLRKNDNSGVKYIVKFEQRFAKEINELEL